MDLDGEIGTTQFALIACDACLRIGDLYDKPVHRENIRGAEFNADAAPLAVPLDDFNLCFCTAHYRFSPLKMLLLVTV
jgi:hypothetical protein